jgi:hypothetical protein
MGALAITIIVAAGLVIGLGVQLLTKPQNRLDWLFVAVASVIGGYVGSAWLDQSVFGSLTAGPSVDGLVIIPAVLVGSTLGLLADAFVRYVGFEPA